MADAGSYIFKATKLLKMSYTRMIHITCTAHKISMKYIVCTFIITRLEMFVQGTVRFTQHLL